jgi:hypothetical protein
MSSENEGKLKWNHSGARHEWIQMAAEKLTIKFSF